MSLGAILRESVQVASDTKPKMTGSAKEVILGATLGTSLAFLIALGPVPAQQMDGPLTVASDAFGFAVPLLALGLLIALADFGPRMPVPATIVVKFAAWVACEGLGALAVLVGLFAWLLHLGRGPALSAIGGAALGLLAPGLVALVILLRLLALSRSAKARGEPTDGAALLRKSPFVAMFFEGTTNSPSDTETTP